MARTNKYTSINFNHVLDKNLTSSSSTSSSSKAANNNTHPHHPSSYSSISANAKTHGRMLVLTRPAPKPISPPKHHSSPLPPPPDQPPPSSDPGSDQISLRPLGRTGSGVLIPGQEREKEKEVSGSPKPDRFVPPHLRPGFVGREARPGPEVFRGREQGVQNHKHFGFGSPGRYGEDGRPKSGGGYERMRRGGDSDLGFIARPLSSGNRPSSSG